jgi:hypothetical protein
MQMKDQIELLIEILLDTNARIDERDDAAMDLGQYNDDRALNALLSIVLNPNEEKSIMDVCGESIAEIWVKRDYFDVNLYNKMVPLAQFELYSYIKGIKPEWIKKFNLKIPE